MERLGYHLYHKQRKALQLKKSDHFQSVQKSSLLIIVQLMGSLYAHVRHPLASLLCHLNNVANKSRHGASVQLQV